MKKKIFFTVKKNGIVQSEVEGVQGPTCESLSLPYIERLGGKTLSYTPKPEYYITTTTEHIEVE